MEKATRRRFIGLTATAGLFGTAGCTQIIGGQDIQDTDGDGVIDSEDYAPRDASVQRRSDVTGTDDPLGSGSKLLVLLTAAVAPLAYRQFG